MCTRCSVHCESAALSNLQLVGHFLSLFQLIALTGRCVNQLALNKVSSFLLLCDLTSLCLVFFIYSSDLESPKPSSESGWSVVLCGLRVHDVTLYFGTIDLHHSHSYRCNLLFTMYCTSVTFCCIVFKTGKAFSGKEKRSQWIAVAHLVFFFLYYS